MGSKKKTSGPVNAEEQGLLLKSFLAIIYKKMMNFFASSKEGHVASSTLPNEGLGPITSLYYGSMMAL